VRINKLIEDKEENILMAIPTQQTISKGSTANDGTGDSLRDAADKINNNFSRLWQDAYNSTDDWPGKSFVIGDVSTTNNTIPSAGKINTYNPNSNMFDFTNFRISQSDQLGTVMTTGVQRDYNEGNGLWDSVETSTVLTMYQKVSTSTYSQYKVVGQYTGTVFFKTKSNPDNNLQPIDPARFPASFNFIPDSSDYWYFVRTTPATLYGEGSLSVGDSCYIKLDKFW